jgi:hypothetical protein
VGLTNVFIEFSPLERSGWEGLGSAEHTLDVVRAVWLLRRRDRVVVYVIRQRVSRVVPRPSFYGLEADGRFYFAFERTRRRFCSWSEQDPEWRETDRVAAVDHLALGSLAILACLKEPELWSVDPCAIRQTQVDDTQWKIEFQVHYARAFLEQVTTPAIDNPWYVMRCSRHWSTSHGVSQNEPFVFDDGKRLVLGTNVRWNNVVAADLEVYVDHQLRRLQDCDSK